LNALESCSSLFTRYGGHAHAVGFSLPALRVAELRAGLEQYARSRLTEADFEKTLTIDEELALHAITPELFEVLKTLEPFGVANPEPVFCSRRTRVASTPKILKEKHVRMKLCPENGSGWRRALTYDAVGWRLAEQSQKEQLLPGDLLDIAYTLERNDHAEMGGLELRFKDFKSASKGVAQSTAS
jgi:single-stranded-DNA-specific exonuclease